MLLMFNDTPSGCNREARDFELMNDLSVGSQRTGRGDGPRCLLHEPSAALELPVVPSPRAGASIGIDHD